jgi:hypothetical protein
MSEFELAYYTTITLVGGWTLHWLWGSPIEWLYWNGHHELLPPSDKQHDSSVAVYQRRFVYLATSFLLFWGFIHKYFEVRWHKLNRFRVLCEAPAPYGCTRAIGCRASLEWNEMGTFQQANAILFHSAHNYNCIEYHDHTNRDHLWPSPIDVFTQEILEPLVVMFEMLIRQINASGIIAVGLATCTIIFTGWLILFVCHYKRKQV